MSLNWNAVQAEVLNRQRASLRQFKGQAPPKVVYRRKTEGLVDNPIFVIGGAVSAPTASVVITRMVLNSLQALAEVRDEATCHFHMAFVERSFRRSLTRCKAHGMYDLIEIGAPPWVDHTLFDPFASGSLSTQIPVSHVVSRWTMAAY